MPAEALAALALFAFVSSATPGPNNTMLLASGVNFGLQRTIPHILGVNLGFPVLAMALGLGLHGLLTAWPWLYETLRWLGAAYLLYLAWVIARTDTIRSAGAGARPIGFWQAVAFQWVNPKAWMMAVGAITMFTPPERAITDLVAVVVIFALVNAPCIVAWASAGVALRRFLDDPRKLRAFNVTMGLLLVLSLYPLVADLIRP